MTNVLLSFIRRVNKSGEEVRRVFEDRGVTDIEESMRKFYAYQLFIKNNVTDFIIREAVRVIMNYADPASESFTMK